MRAAERSRETAEAAAADAGALPIALTGLGGLLMANLVQAVLANTVLEARYSDWLSDATIPSGMAERHIV